MIVIISGANGFLGQHLSLFLNDKTISVIATGRGPFRIENINFPGVKYIAADITKASETDNLLLENRPDWVIHCAAMSKPNDCHTNRDECILQNVTGTKNIIDSCQKTGAKLIYLSTDFIFGENGPHSEEDTPDPLNFYGESKLMAETLVKNSGLYWAIVRPVLIYGKQLAGTPPSFLHWVKSSLENNQPIKVVNDQYRTPTAVTDICEGIYAIVNQNQQGIFHLSGNEILTPHQMASMLAKEYGLDESLITPVTSDTFPEPVKRAKRSGLKNDKVKKILGFNPISFEEGLKTI
ncbi:MAG: SDR family oxidoreductase [Bacteroidota bacterium]